MVCSVTAANVTALTWGACKTIALRAHLVQLARPTGCTRRMQFLSVCVAAVLPDV